jgi:hypothetical protein
LCKAGESLYCSGDCPDGCRVTCATHTPVPATATEPATPTEAMTPMSFGLFQPSFPGHVLSAETDLPMCDDGMLHQWLIILGYLSRESIDWQSGVFGEDTETAVRNFQQAHGLAIDGTVDWETWQVLFGSPVLPAGAAGNPTPTPVVLDELPNVFVVGENPMALAFDGQRVWVAQANSYGTGSALVAIDPATGHVSVPIAVGSCPLIGEPGENTIGGLIFDGQRLWVHFPQPAVPLVQAIDPLTGLTSPPIAYPQCPDEGWCFASQAFGFDGTQLWASGGDAVWAINPQNGDVLGWRGVGWLSSGSMVFDGACMWVAMNESGYVRSFDPGTEKCNVTEASQLPSGILAFDGQRLWSALRDASLLMWMDVATGEVGDPIIVGNAPSALAFDGTRLWVASSDDNTLQPVEVSTGQVGEPVPVGMNPSALLFDGTRLWVANAGDGTVQYIVVDR